MTGAWTRGLAAAAMLLGGGVAWGRSGSAAPAETIPWESAPARSALPVEATCRWALQAEPCPFGAGQDSVLQQIQIAESSQGTLRNSDPAGCWMPGQAIDVTRSTDYDSP